MLKRILGLGSLASLLLLLGAIVMSILTLVGCHSRKVSNLDLFEIRDPNNALNSQYDSYRVGQDGTCAYSSGSFVDCSNSHTPSYFQTDQIDSQGTYPSSSSFGGYQKKMRRLMRVSWILLITTAAVDGLGILCLLLVACVPFIAIPVYIVLGCSMLLCLAAAIIDTIIVYRVRHHVNADNYNGITAHVARGGLATLWSSFAVRMLVVGLMFYLFSVYYKHHKNQRNSNYVDAIDEEYANRPVAYVEAPTEMTGQYDQSRYPQGTTATTPLARTTRSGGTGATATNSIDPTCTKCQGQYDVDPNCVQCRNQMTNAEKSTLGSPGRNSVEHKLE